MVGTRIVACVLWMGEFRNREYDPEWVLRLQSMVDRQFLKGADYQFWCITNADINPSVAEALGITIRRPQNSWPGWWSKIELFRPGLFPEGAKVLYLDLDTLIVGGLAPMFRFEKPAFMPPSYEFAGGKPAGGEGIVDGVQSSCFCFKAGELCHLYANMGQRAIDLYRGDQDYISASFHDYEHMPKEWFQKLRNCTSGPPEGARVILSMPWKNKEAAKKFPWVARVWQ